MSEAEIRKYAKLMDELGLTRLEIEENGAVLRMERGALSPTHAPAAASEWNENTPGEDAKDYISVRSPMVGVFYSAPAENADPYVSVGDRVQVGQTLCIIEAMKLMNEIPAESSGVIQQICVKNGEFVDYGRELFRIGR